MTPFSDFSTVSEIHTYPATTSFTITHDSLEQGEDLDISLTKDVYFVTAHPCVPSSRVKLLKSPTSPTIQQVDVEGHDWNSKASSSAYITGMPTLVDWLVYITISKLLTIDKQATRFTSSIHTRPST